MRIASLLPSATEILFALGLDGEIVGVSPECDFPPAARGKVVVSSNRIHPDSMTAGEIDRAVRENLASGGSLYHVDAERLRDAAPDVIFTQGLCEVCAASLDDVVAVATSLSGRPRVVSLDPVDLDGVLASIVQVGGETGREAEAEELVGSLRERISSVDRRARDLSRPRVACIEWYDPLFTAGHWVPQMVELAGGEEVLARRGERSRGIEWREIATAAPEVVILMPCGFDGDRAAKDAGLVSRLPGWRDLPAVRRGRVFAVDASSYFSRPGPRLVDGLEILAHLLHPEEFPDRAPKGAVRPVAG